MDRDTVWGCLIVAGVVAYVLASAVMGFDPAALILRIITGLAVAATWAVLLLLPFVLLAWLARR